MSPALAQIHPTAAEDFKNEYSLEFLELQDGHSEATGERDPAERYNGLEARPHRWTDVSPLGGAQ